MTAVVNYLGKGILQLHMEIVDIALHEEKADHGNRIYYGVLPPGGATAEQVADSPRLLRSAPAAPAVLVNSQFTCRKKEVFVFSPADSGSTAYFCIRLENGKGEKGPWGPVISAVIP